MGYKKVNRLALVLSGGGARGAYEAGIIHYIRTQIKPADGGQISFDLQCGSSVGAINTCFMASTADDLKQQGNRAYQLWKSLRPDQIYKRNLSALTALIGRTAKGISSNLFSLNPFDPGKSRQVGVHFKSFLDTAPLKPVLNSIIDFANIKKNLKKNVLSAVALTATNVNEGRMELFIQKRPEVEYTGDYFHHFTEIGAEHAMASAAIPIIFPPIKIEDTYYIDGGLKLNTPMSPAIQLGADRILIIGLHRPYNEGQLSRHLPHVGGAPTMGQLVGQVMNALFLDRIQYDIDQLNRINKIVEWSEKVYGKDYLECVNKMLYKSGTRGDIANRGLKRLKVFSISPSKDLSDVFAECYKDKGGKDGSFTAFEKMILRFLDVDPDAGVDILSYLAFIPDYINRLLELGFQDARAQHNALVDFLRDS